MLYFMYTTIVRPIFAYASVVWWPRVKLKSSMIKLNHLQRVACLAITGAMSTTPTLALEAILHIPPLDAYIIGAASSAAYRLNCSGSWNAGGKVVGHALIWERIKSQIPNIGMISDYIRPEFNFNIPYSFVYPTRDWWSTEDSKQMLKDSVTIFTDGSVSESGCGYGVYSPSLKMAIKESLLCTTVFQAELSALLCCAYEASNFKLKNKQILVCTDSLAALHALAKPKINSRLIKDCKEAFLQLSYENTVTFSWVPAHSGVEGNEIADVLARSGARMVSLGPDPAIGLSLNTGKQLIKQWTTDQLNIRWTSTVSCRQTKMYLDKPNWNRSRYILSLKKCDLRALVGVLTGHGRFNVHLSRIAVHSDTTCEHCLEDEDDAEHFVCVCPAFTAIRKIFLSSEVLTKERLRAISWTKLLSFIKASERFEDT